MVLNIVNKNSLKHIVNHKFKTNHLYLAFDISSFNYLKDIVEKDRLFFFESIMSKNSIDFADKSHSAYLNLYNKISKEFSCGTGNSFIHSTLNQYRFFVNDLISITVVIDYIFDRFPITSINMGSDIFITNNLLLSEFLKIYTKEVKISCSIKSISFPKFRRSLYWYKFIIMFFVTLPPIFLLCFLYKVFNFKWGRNNFFFIGEDSYNLLSNVSKVLSKENSIGVLINGRRDSFYKMLKNNFQYRFLTLPSLPPVSTNSISLTIDKCKFSQIYSDSENQYSNVISYMSTQWVSQILSLLTFRYKTANLIYRLVYNFFQPYLTIVQHSSDINGLLLDISNELNYESCVVSHGTHVLNSHNSDYANNEWLYHSYTMLSTTSATIISQSRFLNDFCHYHSYLACRKIINVDFLTYSSPSSYANNLFKTYNIPSNNYVILHASSPRSFGTLRPIIYENISEYIDNLQSIINVISNLNNVTLIVKFRSLPNFTLKDLLCSIEICDSVVIVNEGLFNDYLSISNCLISYSSTTLEEAHKFQIPVISHDIKGSYCHFPIRGNHDNINNDCYCSNSENDLTKILSTLMN